MKALVLATAFLIAAPVVYAKSGKDARKVSSADFTMLPREVLSAQGQPSFKPAYAKLQAVFNEDARHDHKNIVLMGYQVSELNHGITVLLRYGTTTDMWPTGVVPIGTISVPMRWFPDGVVGFESSGEATFEKTK